MKEVGILDATWAPLATVFVALISGIGAWFMAIHKSSGTVKTSEASELWSANSEFRQMLLAEARQRSADNAALRLEAADCHEQQALLEARMTMLEKEIIRLKRLAGEV